MKSRVLTEMSVDNMLREKQFVDIFDISQFEGDKEKRGAFAEWFTVGVLMEKTAKTSSSGLCHSFGGERERGDIFAFI